VGEYFTLYFFIDFFPQIPNYDYKEYRSKTVILTVRPRFFRQAFILPPVAVLLAGRPGQALLNIGLTLMAWVPGIVHALMVISDAKQDRRLKKQRKANKKMMR
jgi:uncharacterized membrane protein YqaE (UPF0057 family)